MEFTAAQVAALIDGEIIGDSERIFNGVTPIEDGMEHCLSFVSQEKFRNFISSSPCSVLVISRNLYTTEIPGKTLILVNDAYESFQHLMNWYAANRSPKKGIESPVQIHDTAALGEDLYIGAFTTICENAKIGNGTQISQGCYIGKNVKIGERVQLAPGVKIMDYCVVGDDCIIHSNTVVGSDGFGFQPTADGFVKIPQLGNVILENKVEIGSNCSIDRGTIGSTLIGEGTKIDNLIQIAHNVKIGKHNVIAAQAGIAGSTVIGDWNMIGGQVGIVGHLKIGNQNRFQAQSGINKSVTDQKTLYGSPAIDASDFRRNYVHFRNLNQIVGRIGDLETAQNNSENKK